MFYWYSTNFAFKSKGLFIFIGKFFNLINIDWKKSEKNNSRVRKKTSWFIAYFACIDMNLLEFTFQRIDLFKKIIIFVGSCANESATECFVSPFLSIVFCISVLFHFFKSLKKVLKQRRPVEMNLSDSMRHIVNRR